MVYQPGAAVLIAISQSRHLPGKHDQSTHGRRRGSGKYVAGRDLIGAGDGSELALDIDRNAAKSVPETLPGDGTHRFRKEVGDAQFNEIARRQGFDGKPKIVDEKQLDDLTKEDHVELFRGVRASGFWEDHRSAADINDQFRRGRLRSTLGVFANGTVYTTKDHAEARSYSDDSKGSIQRMGLRPEARVAKYSDIKDEAREFASSFPRGSIEYSIWGDPGKYAAARGYDAIHIDVVGSYLILNRTAVVAQGPSI